MKVIKQSHDIVTNFEDSFLYEASKRLCVKGYNFIKNYINASLVCHKVLKDQSINHLTRYE